LRSSFSYQPPRPFFSRAGAAAGRLYATACINFSKLTRFSTRFRLYASVTRLHPEGFAQAALGHNSKAVHQAYAKRALMKLPSLEDYKKRSSGEKRLPIQS
jgi:hypothetical protein